MGQGVGGGSPADGAERRRVGGLHPHDARPRRDRCRTSGSSRPTATAPPGSPSPPRSAPAPSVCCPLWCGPCSYGRCCWCPPSCSACSSSSSTASLLLLALRLNPRRAGRGRPRDRRRRGRRHVRRRLRHRRRPRRPRRRRLPAPPVPPRRPAPPQRRRRAGPSTPGTVFLQLDGVGHDVLRDAVARGRDADRRRRWLGWHAAPTHRLTPWRTDWSSQTGASQLGILHGSNHDVPRSAGTRRTRREVMVCNRPTSAAELQRRAVEHTGDGGLLTLDGASRGNLFSGGADQLALVLSVAARRGQREPLAGGLLRLLLRPRQRRAHRPVLRRRGRPRDRPVHPGPAAPGQAPGRARRALPVHPRLRDRRGTRRRRRRGDRRHARRAAPPSTPTSSRTTRWPTTPGRAAGTPRRSSSASTAPSR